MITANNTYPVIDKTLKLQLFQFLKLDNVIIVFSAVPADGLASLCALSVFHLTMPSVT